MNRKMIYAVIAVLCIMTFSVFAQEPTKTSTIDIKFKKWIGDLDGIVQRRLLRVLVAYNKTNYFQDKVVTRGVAYDAMKAFEADLNKKMKLGKLGLNVVFIRVSRDEILQDSTKAAAMLQLPTFRLLLSVQSSLILLTLRIKTGTRSSSLALVLQPLKLLMICRVNKYLSASPPAFMKAWPN